VLDTVVDAVDEVDEVDDDVVVEDDDVVVEDDDVVEDDGGEGVAIVSVPSISDDNSITALEDGCAINDPSSSCPMVSPLSSTYFAENVCPFFVLPDFVPGVVSFLLPLPLSSS